MKEDELKEWMEDTYEKVMEKRRKDFTNLLVDETISTQQKGEKD